MADCCDALELTDFDMVANDTGGAITQVFAAGHPERLHTLTLTNCEAHDNVPPKALLPAVLLARMGLLARLAPRLRDTIPGATEVVEIDNGRLFFPDERAAELTAALRRHWGRHWDAHP